MGSLIVSNLSTEEKRMSGDAAAGLSSRNLIVADIVARTGIDESMIERLARAFYSRARLDPLIGPISRERCMTGRSTWRACAPSGRPSR